MTKIAEYQLPRQKVYCAVLLMGVAFGFINLKLRIDFTPNLALLALLAVAIVATVLLHEGVHALVARLFGHHPLFGLKLPLVYITFTEKISRNHFLLIALAPLIILDSVFALAYVAGVVYAAQLACCADSLRLFANLGFVINTLGAAGDIWMTAKLLGHASNTLVLDTKTGMEIWSNNQ